MTDAGYFAKQVAPKPAKLPSDVVREICSVSHCISVAPDNWIEPWLHNGFGWFNRMADALGVVPEERRNDFRLFAYRIHPEIFRPEGRVRLVVPADVKPDPIPGTFRSLGFDSANRSMSGVVGFECSPLSCNGMAAEFASNEFCLFPSLDAAIAGAEQFAVEQPEPGDYYVVEVLERRFT